MQVWLIEPDSICPSCYEYVANNVALFDLIYTHDDALSHRAGEKGHTLNFAVPSIPIEQHRIPPHKENLVSTIVGAKEQTEGHRLRKRMLSEHGGGVGHVYGAGHRPLEMKVRVLCE